MKREAMSNLTIRVPDELMERVREIAVRDYSREAAVVRRLLRLGIEADAQGERAIGPCEPAKAAS